MGIVQTDVGGKDCTDYALQMFVHKSIQVKGNVCHDRALIQDCKEKICYVALDFDEELKTAGHLERLWKMPSGDYAKIGSEIPFRTAEVLFQPKLVSKLESRGVVDCVSQSIQSCDVDIRREVAAAVVVSGGGNNFVGFEARLAKDLPNKVPNMKLSVHAPKERKYSSWIGGSIITCISHFKGAWIHKAEYLECGPSICQRKL